MRSKPRVAPQRTYNTFTTKMITEKQRTKHRALITFHMLKNIICQYNPITDAKFFRCLIFCGNLNYGRDLTNTLSRPCPFPVKVSLKYFVTQMLTLRDLTDTRTIRRLYNFQVKVSIKYFGTKILTLKIKLCTYLQMFAKYKFKYPSQKSSNPLYTQKDCNASQAAKFTTKLLMQNNTVRFKSE